MPKRFRNGTNTLKIMKFVYYLGMFKHSDLNLMGQGCVTQEDLLRKQKHLQQAERRLREDNFLWKKKRSGSWYVAKGNTVTEDVFIGARQHHKDAIFWFYKNEKNKKKESLNTRRGRRISTTAIMMDAVGCKVFPGEKAELLKKGYTGREPMFYLPREIKRTKMHTYGFASRATGYVLQDDDMYSVFMTGHTDALPTATAEMKAASFSAWVLNETRKSRSHQIRIDTAFVIAEDDYLIERFLTDKDAADNPLLQMYKKTYIFPKSLAGEHMLELFFKDKKLLGNSVSMTGETVSSIDCDMKIDNTYVLNFCLPDIKRLFRFYKAAKNGKTGNKFLVLCFKDQEKSLQFLQKKGINVQTVDMIPFYMAQTNKKGALYDTHKTA